MPSLFSSLWSAVSGNVDTFYGDSFEIHPRVSSGGAWSDDTARLAQTGGAYPLITAALTATAIVEEVKGGDRGPRQRVEDVAATHPMIDFEKSALPYALRNSDRLYAMGPNAQGVLTRTGDIYEVTAPLDDYLSRMQVRVRKLQTA